jgi:hypothetical protein
VPVAGVAVDVIPKENAKETARRASVASGGGRPPFFVTRRRPAPEILISVQRRIGSILTVMDLRIIEEEGQSGLVESEPPWSARLSTLQDLALARNAHAFDLVIRSVAWHHRSASDVIGVIRLALEAGASLAARDLSTTALDLFGDDREVQRFARILAAPTRVAGESSPDPSNRINREWLKTHAGEYTGQWVALRDGHLVGTANSLRELTGKVGDTTRTLLTRAY